MSGSTITLEVISSDSVESLKLKIERIVDIPINEQRLVFVGKQLEEGRTLEDYCIMKESTIHLMMRLKGGTQLSVYTQHIGSYFRF